VLLLVVTVSSGRAKAYKKVIVHVPLKVKHHHHTHTVVKHVHHQVPVHYDHQDVHIIHPEQQEEDWNTQGFDQGGFDDNEYHIPHGRMLDMIIGDSSHQSNDYDSPQDDQYEFEKFMRKRSKAKKKYFTNKAIGWKGRTDFDKIASEYLASIKRQQTPQSDHHHDDYAPYDDEERRK